MIGQLNAVIGNWLPADLVPCHTCIKMYQLSPHSQDCLRPGPDRRLPAGIRQASVPDGSDVEVRTRCFKFLLERAERRIMP